MKPAQQVSLRARLESIAAGHAIASAPGVLQPADVEPHAVAFNAWAAFAAPEPGEPLAAPAELLPPLP